MRARRRRREKRNIGIIEVMCIIAALFVVMLLIAYAVFSHLDQKKAQVSGNTVDRQEQMVVGTDYVDDLLKDFRVGKTDYLVTDRKFTLSGRWYQTIIDGTACYNTVTQGAMVYFQIRGRMALISNLWTGRNWKRLILHISLMMESRSDRRFRKITWSCRILLNTM